MLQDKRDFFVSRINAGYHRVRLHGIVLYVFPPAPSVEYEACEVFNETYEDAHDMGLLTIEQSYHELIYRGLWTDRNEKDLQTAPDNIETLKMELYRAAFKTNTRNKIRERLEITKAELQRLSGLKNSLVPYTCTGLANYAKWNYIIEHSTFLPDGKKYTWDDISLHQVMFEYNSSMLTAEEIRVLARTDPWTAIWSMKKQNGHIFDEPWTAEQKTIVNWSMLYDSVYESPEAPGKDIVSDDDMLDGWLIIKRKEREKDQMQKQGEDAISQNKKIANASEVFIPVETMEDAKRIQEMNTERSQAIRRNRFKQIQDEGSVKHGRLIDVRKDQNLAQQQAYLDRMRKK